MPADKSPTLEYASLPAGSRIRCRVLDDGIIIRIPRKRRSAAGSIGEMLMKTGEMGCAIFVGVPLLAVLIVYWMIRGTFTRDDFSIVGVWLCTVALLGFAYWWHSRGVVLIVRGDSLELRDLTERAEMFVKKSDIADVQRGDERIHIWSIQSNDLARMKPGGDWQDDLTDAEKAWLLRTLRAALDLPDDPNA